MEEAIKEIINNTTFIENLKKSIDTILKDSKVDQYDVPEIIFLINESIKIVKNYKTLDQEQLIKNILQVILDKFELSINPEDKDSFDKLVNSSIKLLLMGNTINTNINCCFRN
jgi:hypothetical protein